MKIALSAALLAALAMPAVASAQVPPQPVPQAQRSPGQHAYQHWMKRLSNLGLSQQQMQQAQNLLGQYASQHPAGSPRDPQAAHALRDQLYGILTPQQQQQLHAETQAARASRLSRQQQQVQPNPPPPTR